MQAYPQNMYPGLIAQVGMSSQMGYSEPTIIYGDPSQHRGYDYG